MHFCPQEIAVIAGALTALRVGWTWIRTWIATKVTPKGSV